MCLAGGRKVQVVLETFVVHQAGVHSRDWSTLVCYHISEVFHLDRTLGCRITLQAVLHGSGGHLQLGD